MRYEVIFTESKETSIVVEADFKADADLAAMIEHGKDNAQYVMYSKKVRIKSTEPVKREVMA